MIEPKRKVKELYRTPPDFLDSRAGSVFRLDRNERTTPFPHKHLKKILSNIDPDEIAAYPELEPFYRKLSNWLKIRRSQVLLTSGSDTGIRAVFEVYVEEGDEVIILSPTYGMYAVYISMFGAVKREIGYDEDLSLPVERVLDAINNYTKLIALANPNHTGTVLSEEALREIIASANKHGAMVLVDEAYFHFYGGTMLPCIDKYDNLIVLRTFSKAFGIAALRVGYLVSAEENISNLYKVKLTHEITGLAARFGQYLIDNPSIMEDYVADVRAGVAFLTEEFNGLGIETPPTHTNFLYANLAGGVDGKELIRMLREKNFYISGPFMKAPFNNHIRVTVGPVWQMRLFFEEFRIIYGTMLQ